MASIDEILVDMKAEVAVIEAGIDRLPSKSFIGWVFAAFVAAAAVLVCLPL